MIPLWEPGVQYNYGDVVLFEGIEYKIIQPHRSQGDWTPTLTPALWGRFQRSYGEEKCGNDYQDRCDYGKQTQYQESDQTSYQAPSAQPTEKHWYDIDEKHKKELEIGAAATALAGGAAGAYYAYKHHGKSEQSYQAPLEQPVGQDEEKHWYDSKAAKVGGAAVLAGGAYAAYKQYEKGSEEAQPAEQHEEEHWYESKAAKIGGAALLAGGAYAAYKHHEKASEDAPAVPPAGQQEEHWYESKAAKIGGAAVLAGGAYAAYKHHEKESEEDPPVQSVGQNEEKHWYDSTAVKVGGAALVAGGAYAAYKHHHEKSLEEKEASAWSQSNWVAESQHRTQQWRSGQYNAPFAWIWNEGRSIPRDAIPGGEERGEALYICRIYHDGALLIGKSSSVFKKGAVIGYKKEEIHFDKYEILVGDSRAVKWVQCSGHLNLEALRARPVEGGREPDGTPIYIAQAPHHGAVHPGKASEAYGDGCFIPYDNSEKKVKEYAVLCYA